MDVATSNPGEFRCPKCPYMGTDETILQLHLVNMHDIYIDLKKKKKKKKKKNKKKKKKKKKKNKQKEEEGKQVFAPERMIKCFWCEIMFPSHLLELHMRRCHPDKIQVDHQSPEDQEDELFGNKLGVGVQKHYTCDACGRYFPSPAQLQSHKKTHPGYAVAKKKKKTKTKTKKKNMDTPCVNCGILLSLFDVEEHSKFCFTSEGSSPPSIFGKSDVMMNQREPRAVFVMVSFDYKHYGALYKIELGNLEEREENEGQDEYTLPLLDPLLQLFDKNLDTPKYCIFHPAIFGSKVHILLNEMNCPYRPPFRPTDAFWFDMNDLDFKVHRFSPPRSPKTWCAVISAYGKLYYLAEPSCYPYIENDSFERYDPTNDSWKSLPPYPWYSMDHVTTMITGHAILYGYILISMRGDEGCPMAAFHIATKTWHQVEVSESMKTLCDGFWGRAIVLDDMIYSISSFLGEIIVFSFCWDSSDNDDIASCKHYLGPRFSLYVRNQARLPDYFDGESSQSLIHLGRRDFCLLETGKNLYSLENQYLRATTVRISVQGKDLCIQTLCSRVFRVATDDMLCEFLIEFSFTFEVEPEEEG